MDKIPWNIPVFSEEEGKRRHVLIRQAMDKEGLDCLVVAGLVGNYGEKSGNFRYLSNYAPWFDDEYIAFPRHGDPTLFAWSEPHAEWCRKISWIKRVEPAGQMSKGPSMKEGAYPVQIAEYIRELGFGQGKIGICDFVTMPVYVYLGLQKALSKADFVDARDMVSRIRMIKSPVEIEFMKKAAACADVGLRAMVEASRPEEPEVNVWAACEYMMTKAGATPPSFTLMASSPSLEAKGLGQPYAGTGRILRKGDIITNEISASYGGYWVQLCAPIVIGTIPDELRRVFEIHKEMYELVLEEVRPGVTLGSIEEKVGKLARLRGCDPSPAWALAHIGLLIRDDIPMDTVLQPNMTLVNHPVTQHGNASYGGHTIGSTLVVTAEGCQVLNQSAMEIYMAPHGGC